MKTSKTIFDYKTVEQYIADVLVPEGYEIELLPGVLVDSYACYAPDENHYNILFVETYISEWSSGLAVHKCKRIGKAEAAFIEAHRDPALV